MWREGLDVKEIDELPKIEWHEAHLWEMFLEVRREMMSGMGAGLLAALRDWCAFNGIRGSDMMAEYYRVANDVMTEIERLKPDGGQS